MTWLHPLTHWPTHTSTHWRVGGWGVSTNQIFKQNWIRSRLIKFLVIWPDPTHWPTHPPNHPHTHTHLWVGVSLQIINLQTELNYLDSVSNFQIFSDLTWPHPSTHLLTHQIIHPPMGGGVSIDFKSSNRIEISRLVQVLLNFEWFWGSPPGGWRGGWMGVGVVRGCTPPTCMCMHACACTRTHVWHHRESLWFPQIQWGQPFAWNYHVYHACMCVHVHMCWGHLPTTPTPIHPSPRATGSRKHQNSITLELIKIIRFCLKILYLWTFLNSYRL